MQNNETKKTLTPQEAYDRQWLKKYNELCFEVFYMNPKGAELLAHMENRFFRSPVAYPNKEPAWAYFNEGRNEHIRSYTTGIQTHMALSMVKQNNNKTKDQRSKIKPNPNEVK